MRYVFLFLLFFLSATLYAQINLIPNHSFETGAGNPYCNNPNIDIGDKIDFWKNAFHSGSSDWMDSLCTNNFTNSLQTYRHIFSTTNDEGIRVELAGGNQNFLNVGHTYKLTYWVASGGAFNMRVYFSNFLANWDSNLPANQKLEPGVGINSSAINGFQPSTWYKIEKLFQIPPTNNLLRNIVFVVEDGAFYLDDVELYDLGCCPEYRQYENTNNLPALTSVIDYIRAGYDAGIPSTSGYVTVLNGQTVTFKAGNQIILEPGFSTEPNANFIALIENCQSSSNSGNINLSFLPNVFTPNCDGINDKLCFTVTGPITTQ